MSAPTSEAAAVLKAVTAFADFLSQHQELPLTHVTVHSPTTALSVAVPHRVDVSAWAEALGLHEHLDHGDRWIAMGSIGDVPINVWHYREHSLGVAA